MLTYSNKETFVWFMAITIWFNLNPYLIWGIKFIYPIFAIVSIFFIAGNMRYFNINLLPYFIIIFILVSVYFTLIDASILYTLLVATYVSLIVIIDKEILYKIYSKYKILFIISLLPSIVLYAFHLLGFSMTNFVIGSIPNINVPNQLKVVSGHTFLILPGAVMVDYSINLVLPRLHAMYIEPGVVGTFSALFLIADKINLKNNQNKVLIVSGLLSFSIAFVILMILGLLLNRRFKILIFSLVLFLILLFYTPKEYFQIINKQLIERLIISDGVLSGNNRNPESLNIKFDEWKKADYFTILKGGGKVDDGSSWKVILIKGGIIAFSFQLFVLFFIVKWLRKSRKISRGQIFFIIVFIISIYQRPNVLAPSFTYLFAGAMIYLNTQIYEFRPSLKKCTLS